MRSRYSAFVLCNEAYLLGTWHPRTRPASIAFEPSQKWLGLRILEARSSGANQAVWLGAMGVPVKFAARVAG